MQRDVRQNILGAELVKVRAILQRNGYPRPIVNQVVDSVVNKLPVETVQAQAYLSAPALDGGSICCIQETSA